jgi:photosystem II stability/assembly factor-like uncharacterized protein
MRRRFLYRSSFLLILMQLLSREAMASWDKIAQLGGVATCCFFFDERSGLAGSGHYDYDHSQITIWFTNDGGLSWSTAITPQTSGMVSSIFMVDRSTGYASIYSNVNRNVSLWKTMDGGQSWFDYSQNNPSYTTCIYKTPIALIKTSWVPGGTNGSSYNDTGKFTNVFNVQTNGIEFSDSVHGVVTGGPAASKSFFTNDGGLTWKQSSNLTAEAWSAYALKGSSIFFAVTEQTFGISVSTDYGATWKQKYFFGVGDFMTGHVHGSGSRIYVQRTQISGPAVGFYRSDDSGATFRQVGGPSHWYDTRAFWVGGCHGEYVIAFDNSGGVWRTTDGGDGTLTTNSNLTYQSITFPQMSSCLASDRTTTLLNTTCGPLILNSITLQNSGGVFFFTPPPLPDTIVENGKRTYNVTFIPNGNPGTYTAQLRLKGYIVLPGNNRTLDTLIQISATALAEPPKFATNLSALDFGGVGICGQSKDSSFTFTNKGCDTLQIVSGPGALAADFTIDPITLPYSLPPDSSVTIRAHFTPTTLGAKTTNPSYTATMQGRSATLELTLAGTGLDGTSVLDYAPKAIGFDTISICGSPDSADGFITNIGCVPMTVENFALAGDAAFTLVSGNLTGQDVPPRDSLHYRIRFTPIAKGAHAAQLAIRTKNKSGTGTSTDAAVSINGNVNDGTKLLAVAPPSIDFGTTTLCEEKSGTVTLRNTGCDSVIVTDALLAGLGFQISGFVNPTILPPGGSLSVTINTKVDTTGGKTTNTGTLTFKSNAQNVLSAVTFTRSIRLPGKVGIELASVPLDPKYIGTAGDIVSFLIKQTPGLEFAGSGISTLDFDILYNTDLLGYIRPQGPNSLVSNDGKHFTLSNSPEIKADVSGTLAEIFFQIYLTKDSTTTLTLANPVASDGGSQGQCASTAVASGTASITYTYVCADHFIQSYMRGDELGVRIVSLAPNPAKDELQINTFAAGNGVVTVEVYNEIGKRLIKKDQMLVKGSQIISLSASDLPSGIYSLRIGGTSGRFVKEK